MYSAQFILFDLECHGSFVEEVCWKTRAADLHRYSRPKRLLELPFHSVTAFGVATIKYQSLVLTLHVVTVVVKSKTMASSSKTDLA